MRNDDNRKLLKILGYKEAIEKIASEQKKDMFSIRMNKIKSSANKSSIIEISYKNAKNEKTKRLVEPYKLTGDDFWGYDINKDAIRRFKTKNIKGIKSTNQKFDPRWNIEMLWE